MKRQTLFLILLAALLALGGCARETVEEPELLTPVGASMDTARAEVGTLEEIAVYPGAVAPRFHSLWFTHDAVIGSTPALLGQAVKKGDILVEMDVSRVNAQIAALDAESASLIGENEYQSKLKEIDLELYAIRMEQAQDEESRYDAETEMLLCRMEYENAQADRDARLEAIAVQRGELEAQLVGTALESPSDGRVALQNCRPGQSVGAYDILCVVTDDEDRMIQSDFIPASALADAVEIYALIGAEKIPLTAEAVDEGEYARTVLKGGQYLSTFATPHPENLKLGQSAAVCLVTLRKDNVLKVPVNAVFEDGGETVVYRVEDGARVRQSVSTGAATESEIEILDGLAEGDVVYVGE